MNKALSCVFTDYFEAAKQNLELTVPGLVTGPNVAKKHFANASMMNETSYSGIPSESITHLRHSFLQRFQARVVSDMNIISLPRLNIFAIIIVVTYAQWARGNLS